MPVISGTCSWAKVHQPHYDQYNEDGVFSIDVTVDAKTKESLKKLGLITKVKNKDDERNDFITIKRKYTRKDGTKNSSPRVVDAKKNPISPDILIGNGSSVNVLFDTYDYNVAGNKGVGMSLKAVQVTKLLEYSPDGNIDELAEANGYVTPSLKGIEEQVKTLAKDSLDENINF
ncbi:MAG: hypothetical protein CMC70_00640 [Flavobacteriaceae bacterium]|nr:hypothetical protein [Flavobacteriaceae bacterium]